MNQPYTAPSLHADAFNCPTCGAYASQRWTMLGYVNISMYETKMLGYDDRYLLANCSRCNNASIWLDGNMVFPLVSTAALPNQDMPEDVRKDYEEARKIVAVSPRGAAALLRLAIQKLCFHLGEKGKNINDDIASLVKKGLPESLQKALDSVRVVGNNAVHPGQLDFDDNTNIAQRLFGVVNFICENRITQPKMINELYDDAVSEKDKGSIARRDGQTQ